MRQVKLLAATLSLIALLCASCAQPPYVKSQKRSGEMMNAAEADNQAGRRRAIQALSDKPTPQPSPELSPQVSPIIPQVKQ